MPVTNDITWEEASSHICKQFSLTKTDNTSYQELHGALTARIRYLLNSDFHHLINILYRIDVPEEKLKGMLQGEPEKEAASVIATLMIERTLQKIRMRRQFKNDSGTIIPDDEKW